MQALDPLVCWTTTFQTDFGGGGWLRWEIGLTLTSVGSQTRVEKLTTKKIEHSKTGTRRPTVGSWATTDLELLSGSIVIVIVMFSSAVATSFMGVQIKPNSTEMLANINHLDKIAAYLA